MKARRNVNRARCPVCRRTLTVLDAPGVPSRDEVFPDHDGPDPGRRCPGSACLVAGDDYTAWTPR